MYRAVRVVITGRVQGVGFRDFVRKEAASRKLDGWVRNRHDGSVEAMFAGTSAAVHSMIEAVEAGSPLSRVTGVAVAPFADEVPPGFHVLASY